jgi:hypothetical protein
MTKENKKNDDPAAYFVPAALFIGLGLGFLTGNLLPGLFIGLGVGFLGMFISKLILRDKSK